MKFDDLIVNYLGEFGRYQKLQFFLVCLPTIITAMHALSWTFTAANLPHRCRLPDETGDSNYSIGDNSLLRRTTCNLEAHPEWTECPYEQCWLDGNNTCPYGYVFDRHEITYSAVYRWEIVCDRAVLKAVIQSMYYVGQMLGSLIFGFLGDRIGRKKVFIIAIVVQIVCGAGMAFAPHWIVFSILRIGLGFAHPGKCIFVIAVVIGMELVGPSKRKVASVVTGIFFSLGQMALGVIAYFVRDYQYLQAIIALPALGFLVYWWIIPESARWLVSQRRYSEADAVLQKAAKMNKTQLPVRWWEEIELTSENSQKSKVAIENRKHNFLDLVRTPKMRRISLSAFFCWPVVSMVYYGVSMNTNFLGGNLYTTFVFGALMEVPAVLVVFFVVDRIGRKPLLAGGYIVAALCMLSNLAFTEEPHWLVTMTQFLLAKAAITCTYATIYTFTPELFPTVIRNTAMGTCSMMARLGAILASYISMWLVDWLGKIAMIVPFASLAILAAIVTLVFLPETNGKQLPESIDEVEGIVPHHEMQPLSSKASSNSKAD